MSSPHQCQYRNDLRFVPVTIQVEAPCVCNWGDGQCLATQSRRVHFRVGPVEYCVNQKYCERMGYGSISPFSEVAELMGRRLGLEIFRDKYGPGDHLWGRLEPERGLGNATQSLLRERGDIDALQSTGSHVQSYYTDESMVHAMHHAKPLLDRCSVCGSWVHIRQDSMRHCKTCIENWHRIRKYRDRQEVRQLRKAMRRRKLMKKAISAIKITGWAPTSLKQLEVHSRLIGVYFLYHEEELVYIGESVNILSRIGNHTKDKTFTKCHYIDASSHAELADQDVRRDVEASLIMFFRPRYNHPDRTRKLWKSPLRATQVLTGMTMTEHIHQSAALSEIVSAAPNCKRHQRPASAVVENAEPTCRHETKSGHCSTG